MASAGFPGIEPIAEPPLQPVADDVTKPDAMERVWGLDARVDGSVTFEEYIYWAKIERADEVERNRLYVEKRGPLNITKVIKNRFSKGIHHEEKKEREATQAITNAETNEKTGVVSGSDPSPSPLSVTEEEWRTAARALKTASWGTVFFLITTDILGWGSCPYVFSTVGYGPGVVLYVIFGIAAGFSGWILWRVYLGLDSSQYPILSYGDTFFRVYGKKSRHFINVTQSLQQFLTVAVLILGIGQVIAQMSKAKICYIVCFLIFMFAGMIAGSVRSLQRVGWFANASVWMNIVSFLIIMVACANYPVDYEATTLSTRVKTIGPIVTFAGPPPDEYQPNATGFAGQFNGINQMVYSYGGALLFVAFLAEMRHPLDFWKGLMVAQLFICFVYILFGAFVYSHYGQYSAQVITTAVQPFDLQTVGNVFAILTGAIACVLYFNIGMKTVYIEVFQEVLHFPSIASKKGRLMWYALGPMYWIIAFLVAAAVPNLNGVSGFVGALLILNFTYTFPAILYVGYMCQLGAVLPGEGFDPITRITTRHDSGWKRWVRGYLKYWHINTTSFLYFLGGLATSGMGCWAAIEGLIIFFQGGSSIATSFGCAVPV